MDTDVPIETFLVALTSLARFNSIKALAFLTCSLAAWTISLYSSTMLGNNKEFSNKWCESFCFGYVVVVCLFFFFPLNYNLNTLLTRKSLKQN